MKSENCKGCPFLRVFYRGTESNPAFSETCYWTLKKPEDVKPEECKRGQQKQQEQQEQH